MTDDEAIIIMVDSNLQREQILPSEKAFAYKLKLDVMKRQGKRTDLTSEPVAWKLKEIRQKGNALLLVRLSLCRYIFFYLDVNIF